MRKIHLYSVFVSMVCLMTACSDKESEVKSSSQTNDVQIDKSAVMKLPFREIVDTYYANNFYLGIANHSRNLGTLSTEIADREFNYITPANDFKQSYIHPVFDQWRWEKSDAYLSHAKEKDQKLRIHGPISPQCSSWVKEDNRTPEELTRMLEEYMTQLCTRYAHEPNILWMDVVNETIVKEDLEDPLFGSQKRGDWFSARQGTEKWENPWTLIGYDEESEIRPPMYINMAFEISNTYAPQIKQIINQHGNFEEIVWERMKQLVTYLRTKGRRVDGLGWQAHIDTGWEKIEGNVQRLDKFISWCHAHDLEFHITEMNVWIKDKDVTQEIAQAETFAAVINTVLKHQKDGVVGINLWNVRDKDTAQPNKMGCLWRNDGSARPAYTRIKEILIENIPPQKTN